jgi:hypothetical protein
MIPGTQPALSRTMTSELYRFLSINARISRCGSPVR